MFTFATGQFRIRPMVPGCVRNPSTPLASVLLLKFLGSTAHQFTLLSHYVTWGDIVPLNKQVSVVVNPLR